MPRARVAADRTVHNAELANDDRERDHSYGKRADVRFLRGDPLGTLDDHAATRRYMNKADGGTQPLYGMRAVGYASLLLSVVKEQLALRKGDPKLAKQCACEALDGDPGRKPKLLGARDSECGYAWGEGNAL